MNWTASDESGNTATDTQTVTILPTRPRAVLIDTKKSYIEAQRHCALHYGSALASLPDAQAYDEAESMLIAAGVAESVWMSITRPTSTSNWYQSDTNMISYVSWVAFGAFSSGRDCAGFRTYRDYAGAQRNELIADSCTKNKKFLCWDHGMRSQYYTVNYAAQPTAGVALVPDCPQLSTGYLTWQQARDQCSGDPKCHGFEIDARYGTSSYQHRRTQVRFNKKAAACAQSRQLSSGQLAIVPIYKIYELGDYE